MAIIATIVCILVILTGLAILAASTIGLPWAPKKPIRHRILMAVLGVLLALLPIVTARISYLSHRRIDNFLTGAQFVGEGGWIPDLFTRDGVEYIALPLNVNYFETSEHCELAFKYRGEFVDEYEGRVFFEHEVYRVNTVQDFVLMYHYEDDRLYCPTDQANQAMAHYGSLASGDWRYWYTAWEVDEDWEDRFAPKAQDETLERLHGLWYAGEEQQVPLLAPELRIYINVDDEIVQEICYIVALDGTDAYLVTREEEADGKWISYGIPLPEDLSAIVHALAAE